MSLSEITFGGGAFNTSYNLDGKEKLDNVAEVLQHAFDQGITTIDTAAFYGPSETLIGEALTKINVDRSKIQICSKCCRWEDNSFGYTRADVESSVNRSLERLKTTYLDVLYIHDVEFGPPEGVLEAINTAFKLKDQGIVKNVGVSGYPLTVLLATARMVKDKLGRPLDAVLSYCNLNLQNTLLLEYKPLLQAAGVKVIGNASPLSMSMLRSGPTHAFHMGNKAMRDRADAIGADLLTKGVEIADVATQFAFAQWDGPTVIGLRTISEIDSAIENYKASKEHPDPILWKQIESEFGEYFNATWEEDLRKQFRSQWDLVEKQYQ